MTKKELAIANHDKKYNCCQAVACSFCKEIGVDEETLFRAGEAFGWAWAAWTAPAAPFQEP